MSKPRKNARAAVAIPTAARTKKNIFMPAAAVVAPTAATPPPPTRRRGAGVTYEMAVDWRTLAHMLDRDRIAAQMTEILSAFEKSREDAMFKKGIYIYGPPGAGKTEFVMNLLAELKFDVVKYDTGDVRNKALIDTITKHNMSDTNVLSAMRGEPRKIAILMDEIDGMNNGDKGGITALIKLIRQKKTKKQKLEDITLNPIICIGNYHTDKKIRELMKVCNTFELKAPTITQTTHILQYLGCDTRVAAGVAEFTQGDLRKLGMYYKMSQQKPEIFATGGDFFLRKTCNENTKKITDILLNSPQKITEHNVLMNETDRTIVALLWHENIVDRIPAAAPVVEKMSFYLRILDNICFSDYIDRLTFQHQIWQFNEMTSLVKTFHNNQIFHDTFPAAAPPPRAAGGGGGEDIRFTKVLTKYSTEYNNILFVYNLCQQLDMDQKDVLTYFRDLREKYGDVGEPEVLSKLEKIFENYEINKLYIKRIYRYIDKNVKRETAANDEDLLEEDDDFCGCIDE